MKFLFVLMLFFSFNAFADTPTYTIKRQSIHGMGLVRTEKSMKFVKSLIHHEIMRGSVIPGKYDLTPLVSPPEDQGQCGSCWDFSLTKALRSALMLAGKDSGTLAFNYLLNNCGPGPAQGGCNGGDFDAGQSFLNQAGPWLEKQDPYTQQEGQCMSGLAVAGTAIEMVTVGDNSPSFQMLASAISQRHMLSIDVAVAGQWGNYSSGIYNGNGSGINHMINMVGYDCQTSVDAKGNCLFDSNGEPINGDGFLIVMNNWGTSWGEKGYMRTRAHRNQIATTAVYFTVKPVAINGGWSNWGPWSACIDGQQTQIRTCTNPAPENGGATCEGQSLNVQKCGAPPTPPSPGGLSRGVWIGIIAAIVVGLAIVISLVF